jgi:hypothetical protein
VQDKPYCTDVAHTAGYDLTPLRGRPGRAPLPSVPRHDLRCR